MSKPSDKIANTLVDPEHSMFSPADLEEIGDDPTQLGRRARIMGAHNIAGLFLAANKMDASPTLRVEVQKLLNKMGGLEPKEEQHSGGPQVIINITRAKDNEATVIEGKATLLSSDES